MTDARPDPDQLLAQVKAQEASARRGRLRIYFGASAGVGKTYAMLTAARALRHEGKDVVVGLLETHGRKETEALLQGLEILPRAKLPYQDRTLEEFDLDAALARRPALILVDELAHTNVAGSRHPKRWQDIDELLAAGIDVFSTLNVQHIESLNDVVGGITGINVWETVPDFFFDQADEVVLVDVSADDLLARLAAGKVYLPEQIERAASNFFRKGNLMALRELALRRTADRVEDDVQAYRSDKAIERVWKTEDSLLCCIGPGPGGEDLVRSAARLAAQLGVDWTAAYVETPALQRLPAPERERILKTVKLAQEFGANTAILAGGDPAAEVVEYARSHNCSKVVVGRTRVVSRWPWARGMARRVGELAPDIDLIEVGRGDAQPVPPREPDVGAEIDPRRGVKRLRYLWALLACLGDSARRHAAAALLRSRQHRDAVPADGGAGRREVGTRTRGAGGVRQRGDASISSSSPPRFSFAVSDFQYLLTFAVMLAVALDHRPDDRRSALSGARRVLPRGARPRALRIRARHVEPAADRRRRRGGDEVHHEHLSRQGRDPGARRPGSAAARHRQRDRTRDRSRAPRSGRTTSRSRRAPAPTRSPATSTCICRCGRRCARAACW